MKKKKTKILSALAMIVAVGFILNILFPTVIGILSNNDSKSSIQEKQATATQESTVKNELTYYTRSTAGNIEIGVFFRNPLLENTDDLVFDIAFNTHSVDLSKYKDLSNFLELRIVEGIVIKDGIDWEVAQADNHHISGTLRIKNNYNGKPIYSENTKYLNLVFKNIGINEREHIYEGNTLK